MEATHFISSSPRLWKIRLLTLTDDTTRFIQYWQHHFKRLTKANQATMKGNSAPVIFDYSRGKKRYEKAKRVSIIYPSTMPTSNAFGSMNELIDEEKKEDEYDQCSESTLLVGNALSTPKLKSFSSKIKLDPASASPSSSNKSSKQVLSSASGDAESPYELASAMARMRDSSTQKKAFLNGKSRSSAPQYSPEEIMAKRQRNWKRLMKIAQEKKRQERLALDGRTGPGGSGLVDIVLSNLMYQCGMAESSCSEDSEDNSICENSSSDFGSNEPRSRGSKLTRRPRSSREGNETLPSPPVKTPTRSREKREERRSEKINNCLGSSGGSAPAQLKEKNFIKTFTHDIQSHGCAMLWHKESSSMQPSTATLFLKPGYRSQDGLHNEPGLTWADAKQKRVSYGFSLFAIRSLERAHSRKLQGYPSAIPGRSVFIRLTGGRELVFEAKSEQDCLWFVHGLRWLIARLSVNLVIGNLDVSCELLDVGGGRSSSKSLLEEAECMRAMDDVTDQLVEKSVFH